MIPAKYHAVGFIFTDCKVAGTHGIDEVYNFPFQNMIVTSKIAPAFALPHHPRFQRQTRRFKHKQTRGNFCELCLDANRCIHLLDCFTSLFRHLFFNQTFIRKHLLFIVLSVLLSSVSCFSPLPLVFNVPVFSLVLCDDFSFYFFPSLFLFSRRCKVRSAHRFCS